MIAALVSADLIGLGRSGPVQSRKVDRHGNIRTGVHNLMVSFRQCYNHFFGIATDDSIRYFPLVVTTDRPCWVSVGV